MVFGQWASLGGSTILIVSLIGRIEAGGMLCYIVSMINARMNVFISWSIQE
jgi:hypothetical protein